MEAKVEQYIGIQISEGRAVISDYSTSDDRKPVLVLFQALGVSPTEQEESWCG